MSAHDGARRSDPPASSELPLPGHPRPVELLERPQPPGQGPLVAAGLAIGLLMMAMQLWLLTIALEMFLAGHGSGVWSLALISGLIFLGGLGMLWLLRRRPRVARPRPPGASQ